MTLALATQTEVTIEELVDQLIGAKSAERNATAQRVAIEEQIIAQLGKRDEGSQTHELISGMKVTITGKLSYKADMEKLQAICAKLPPEMRPLKTETKLDETGAKYLRNNEPQIWAKLAAAITLKDAKPSIEIKA
jgi:hypothetical protein